ncbi:MAG: Ig domain-containing protein [Acidimicrobiales bacterium]
MSGGRRGRALLVIATAGLTAAMVLPAAARAGGIPTFTWTGGDAAKPHGGGFNPNWSDAGNWSGGVAPSSGSALNLVFPQMSCGLTCDQSTNDVTGLTVNSLVVTVDYATAGSSPAPLQIGGLSITLDGLSASTSNRPDTPLTDLSPQFHLPIVLGADQTWHLDGGCTHPSPTFCAGLVIGPNFSGGVSGTSALTVVLAHGTGIDVASMNVGPISIQGADTSVTGNPASVANGAVFLGGGTLNSNGNPVTVTDAGFVGFGEVGPLSIMESDLQPNWFGATGGPQPLRVDGALTLDHATMAQWPFLSSSSGSFTNLSPTVDASGMATVNATALRLGVGCNVPTGTTFTLLHGASFVGQFDGVDGPAIPDNAVIHAFPDTLDPSCSGVSYQQGPWVRIHYTADAVTATVVPSPLSITTPSLPNGTIAQPYSATLTAANGTSPYHWSIASGNLPTNLALSPSGVISGTPLVPGTATFTVRVTDNGSPAQTAIKPLSITVGTGTPLDPVIVPVGTQAETVLHMIGAGH